MPHMLEARSKEDDWAGVSNLAMRKKRQNRLNQRALRRRRQAKKLAYLQEELVETTPSKPSLNMERQADSLDDLSWNTIDSNAHITRGPGQQNALEQMGHQPALSIKSAPRFECISEVGGPLLIVSIGPTTIVLDLYTYPLPADHLLTLVRYNLYRACAANSSILGLDPRSLHDDITSPFYNLRTFNHPLPKSLLPTETQITARHHPYIDIFPFSNLRDKLILSQGTVDEDELCADLGGKNSTTEHTGLIVWNDSWDPMGWELSEYVAIKWARLFGDCEELLTATNYWRNTRGEVPLKGALFSPTT
ncbi:hypothetical protein GQX73_g9943 [Xylaria multiplex]|uniref:BZIP domain-containing protein n=1 Tax=Xylaria multiplex TaxID=323545 RepID=A0A7C8MLM9_9PEZI|nr:hypothetical protein GQX73_g9943 [Xylaria multiplex]